MRQYYRQAIEQDGNLDIFDAQVSDEGWNGVKLMEHSWIGNSFMDAISERIHNKPANIVWCGDYGDECVDSYMVGAWAGNTLEITDVAPEGYELEDVRFSEEENYDDDRVE